MMNLFTESVVHIEENAINKREKEIVELKEFVRQIKKPLVAEEIIFSVFYCKGCHNEILT